VEVAPALAPARLTAASTLRNAQRLDRWISSVADRRRLRVRRALPLLIDPLTPHELR